MRTAVTGRRRLPASTVIPLTLAFAVFAVGAIAPAARAQEVGWGGFYTGAQLGGAWADADWTYKNPNYFNGAVVSGSAFSQDPDGIIGGVLGGYNYTLGPWLLGVELSASAANLSQERASTLFPASDTTKTKLNWLTSISGRLGYAWDRWLVYGKGGWAGGEVNLTLQDAGGGVYASEDQWATGWTVGGGLEYMINPWLSLGVGYDYADLSIDNKTVTCTGCGGGVGLGTPIVDGDVKVQSVTARLTFHPWAHP